MKFFERIARSFGYAPVKTGKRSFQAGAINRLTGSWGVGNSGSIDADLAAAGPMIRQRARDLCANNDYARRFLRVLETSVVGDGFSMTVKGYDDNGKLDQAGSKIVENAFWEWAKRENCSVCGRLSLAEMTRLVLSTTARDGEVIVRMVKGFPGSAHKFALQIIEADHLSDQYSGIYSNGNEIRRSVEIDQWGRIVALHLNRRHPGDALGGYTYRGQYIERIDASECLLIFITERPGQSRGFSWMATSLTRMNHISEWEESSLISQRCAAAKMGFLQSNDGDGMAGETDEEGNILETFEPGTISQLPHGYTFQAFSPGDTAGHDEFMKRTLRGISAGLGLSYHTLSTDMEGVSFSSARVAVLEERDFFKVLQDFLIAQFLEPVFAEWIKFAFLTDAIKLPITKLKKFSNVSFRGRRWSWVDPARELTATTLGIQAGLQSRTAACAEQGREFSDILEELAAEKIAMEKAGVTILADIPLMPAEEEFQNGKKTKTR